MPSGYKQNTTDLDSLFAPRGTAPRANVGFKLGPATTDLAQRFEDRGSSTARANVGLKQNSTDLAQLFMDINWKTVTPTPTPTPLPTATPTPLPTATPTPLPTATPTPTPTTMMYQFTVNGGGLGFSSGTGTGLYVSGATVTVTMTYSAGYEHDYLSTTPSWTNSFVSNVGQTWTYQGTMPAATQTVTPVGKLLPAPTPTPTATPTPTPTPAPACHNQNLYYDCTWGYIDMAWTDCGAGANSFADYAGSGWECAYWNTYCITDGTLSISYGSNSQGATC